MRVPAGVWQPTLEFLLHIRSDVVLHAHGRIVEVVAGKAKVMGEVTLPEAMGPHQACRRPPAGLAQPQAGGLTDQLPAAFE